MARVCCMLSVAVRGVPVRGVAVRGVQIVFSNVSAFCDSLSLSSARATNLKILVLCSKCDGLSSLSVTFLHLFS